MCESEQPPLREPCNMHECPQWSVSNWTTCSSTCNQKGNKTRSVICMYKGARLETYNCRHLPKPTEVEECQQENCGVWREGKWSDCPIKCGKGLRTRSVYCVIEVDAISSSSSVNNHTDSLASLKHRYFLPLHSASQSLIEVKVDESKCDSTIKPANESECGSDSNCPEWRTTTWSSCSVSCGQGLRMRDVYCSTGKDRDCLDPKPLRVEACHGSECSSTWQAGNWSQVILFD
jgi:hypothetical protein